LLLRRRRGGNTLHRQMTELAAHAAGQQRRSDRLPEPTLGAMVLYHHDRAGGCDGAGDRLGVQRLDAVGIDDRDRRAEVVDRGERLVNCDPRRHHHSLVGVAAPERLRATELEDLVGLVEHRGVAPGGAQVPDPRHVRQELDQGPALVWIWAAVLVAATFVFGMVFPKLRPDYLTQQGQASSEAESVAG